MPLLPLRNRTLHRPPPITPYLKLSNVLPFYLGYDLHRPPPITPLRRGSPPLISHPFKKALHIAVAFRQRLMYCPKKRGFSPIIPFTFSFFKSLAHKSHHLSLFTVHYLPFLLVTLSLVTRHFVTRHRSQLTALKALLCALCALCGELLLL